MQVGDVLVGVRSNTAEVDDLIRRAFECWIVREREVGPHYSVRIVEPEPASSGRGPASRELHTLYHGGSLIARSRSASRVLRALAAHLGGHRGTHDHEMVRVNALALITGAGAVLAPPSYRGVLPRLEPRLRQLGIGIVDEPDAALDAQTGELVVGDSDLELDEAVLTELDHRFPSRRTGDQGVPRGRYSVAAWLYHRHANGNGASANGGESPAREVAALVPLVTNRNVLGAQRVLDGLSDLSRRGSAEPFDLTDVSSLLERLRPLAG